MLHLLISIRTQLYNPQKYSGIIYALVHMHRYFCVCVHDSARPWYAACYANESLVTLSFAFSPPSAFYRNLSDWPFGVRWEAVKMLGRLRRFQKLGWACILKNNSIWHFYPLSQISDVSFFFPTAEIGSIRSLG